MADRLTPARRSRNMSRIRGTDTEPERLVRSFLHRVGIRYRTNDRSLPGRPDIVIPRARTAVFVHGCYWHRHEGCHKATTPRTNTDFWLEKFSRNRARDEAARIELERRGYRVLTFWQCDVERNNAIAARLGRLRPSRPS